MNGDECEKTGFEFLKTAGSFILELTDLTAKKSAKRKPFDRKWMTSYEKLDALLDEVKNLVILLPGDSYQVWDFTGNLETNKIEIHTIEGKYNRRIFFRQIDEVVTAEISVNFDEEHISVDFHDYFL